MPTSRNKGTNVNLRPLQRFRRKLREARSRASRGIINAMFEQWGGRQLTYMRRRFRIFSLGGGDWPALAPSTIARRRGKKGKKNVAILRDTSTMYNALAIGVPGNLFKRIEKGIRVGFGGPAKHPSGKVTIRQLANIHNEGKGNNPERQIIVYPDEATSGRMAQDAARALRKLGKECEGA